jgi:hypothetical protein
MEEHKIKALEAKLREMFEMNDQPKSRPEQMQVQPAGNYVIRRRKGEQDKRIFISK